MLISRKSKYGLMALMNLARNPSRAQVLIADLANEENIPKKFLEAILLILRNGGILTSRIGKGGGYSLGLHPKEITLGKIIHILEGDFSLLPCISNSNYVRCEECENEESCGIRLVMLDVQHAMDTALDAITLADMVARSEAARQMARNVVDYHI